MIFHRCKKKVKKCLKLFKTVVCKEFLGCGDPGGAGKRVLIKYSFI